MSSSTIQRYLRYVDKYRLVLASTLLFLVIIFIDIVLIELPYIKNPRLSLYTRVRLDYILWLIVLLSVSLCINNVYRYRYYSILSTIFLDLIGLIFVVFGRLASTLYCLFNTSFEVPILGGGLVLNEALAYSLYAIIGSCFVILSTIVHEFISTPHVFIDTISVQSALSTICRAIHSARTFLNNVYAVSFMMGFLFRLIPEILWWPWPLGWDTIEYAAHLKDFIVDPNPFKPRLWLNVPRITPPLIDLILYPFALFIDPLMIFKFFPSIAYGIMVMGTVFLSKRVFKLRDDVALVSGLVVCFSIMVLRVSWDLLRQLLSMALMPFVIAIVHGDIDNLRCEKIVKMLILLILLALSHEIGTMISLFLAVMIAIYRVVRYKDLVKSIPFVVYSIIAVLMVYTLWSQYIRVNPLLGVALPTIASCRSIHCAYGASLPLSYVLAGFSIYIPPILGALSELRRSLVYTLTLVLLMVLGLSPLITPYTYTTAWYRLLYSIIPLLAPLVAIGIYRYGRRAMAMYLTILLLPALAYELNPSFLLVYSQALGKFPTGLIPIPADKDYLQDLYTASKIVANLSITNNKPIIAPGYIARWIHLWIRNPQKTLWWIKNLKNFKIICNVMSKSKSNEVYVVTLYGKSTILKWYRELKENHPEMLCGSIELENSALKIVTIKDGRYKVYMISIESLDRATQSNTSIEVTIHRYRYYSKWWWSYRLCCSSGSKTCR